MSEKLPEGTGYPAFDAGQDPVAAAPVPATPVPAAVPRRHARPGGVHAPLSAAGTWQRWLLGSALAGIGWGIVWWLAAPGGAFYGDGTDYAVWLPRDLVLGAISVLAGFGMGVLLVRAVDRPGGRAGAVTRLLAATVGGLLGSVVAWRMGVFAGDLFHTPPANMPNPSIVFSLRSSSILLLWPLVAAAVVFAHTFFSYVFVPARSAD